jgi:hypothetical protein
MRKFLILASLLVFLGTETAPLARAAEDPVQRAIAWLHTQQLADGSFGGDSVTADVVYVLALAGEDPGSPAWTPGRTSALTALEKAVPTYMSQGAGQAGKVARAVAAAGRDPRNFAGIDIISVIKQAYDPATGRYHPTQLFHHTLAVEALWRAGQPVPAAAINALLVAQLPNGGWYWAFPNPAYPLPQPDVDSTGRVLQLLAGMMDVQALEAYARTAKYLFAWEEASGWSTADPNFPGPPNVNSTALAIAGLRAAGYDPQSACFQRGGLGAVGILLTYQEQSGRFVYRVGQPGSQGSQLMATADALVGLLQPLTQPPAVTPVCRPVYLPLVLR